MKEKTKKLDWLKTVLWNDQYSRQITGYSDFLKRRKTQISNNNLSEKGDTMANFSIKRTVQVYANKFETLTQMDNFLRKYQCINSFNKNITDDLLYAKPWGYHSQQNRWHPSHRREGQSRVEGQK